MLFLSCAVALRLKAFQVLGITDYVLRNKNTLEQLSTNSVVLKQIKSTSIKSQIPSNKRQKGKFFLIYMSIFNLIYLSVYASNGSECMVK